MKKTLKTQDCGSSYKVVLYQIGDKEKITYTVELIRAASVRKRKKNIKDINTANSTHDRFVRLAKEWAIFEQELKKNK